MGDAGGTFDFRYGTDTVTFAEVESLAISMTIHIGAMELSNKVSPCSRISMQG